MDRMQGWNFTVWDIVHASARYREEWVRDRLEDARFNLRCSPGHPFQSGVRDACLHFLKRGTIEARAR